MILLSHSVVDKGYAWERVHWAQPRFHTRKLGETEDSTNEK